MSFDEDRVRRNEEIFRHVNERVEGLAENFPFLDRADPDFVCECGDRACIRKVNVDLDAYRHVRTNDRRFVVAPGHVEDAIESVVERNERFWVVEKAA